MRIALFPSAFHPSLGGVEELTRQLAHQLGKDGHEVLLVTNRWPKTLAAYEEFEGMPLRRYACRVPGPGWKQNLGTALLGPSVLAQMCRDLAAFNPDVLHAQCISSVSVYALRAARKLGRPYVATLQGELTMDASRIYQRLRSAQQRMCTILTEADRITACSRHTLQEAESFWGQPFGSRGSVVFNGVQCAEFIDGTPCRRPRPYLFALGRHVPQKGFDLLLHAFARLDRPAEREFDLVLAGDGPDRAELEALAQSLGISERVHFPGRVDHAQAVGLFLGAAFFVLPSRADEGLPVVIAEALAAGRPIVATRSGGTPQAVTDDVNGFLLPKDDEQALHAALRRMLESRARWDAMGQASRRASTEFDWAHIATEYVRIYEAAGARGRSRG